MTTSITSLPSASVPLTGTERVPMDQTIGSAVAASALVVGTGYRIESLGTTNWTACGLPAGVTAAVGLTFVATAAGTGTGTAIEAQTVEATAAAIAALAPATNLTYDQATRLLSSSTGTDVTLPLATASLPGLESAEDKAKLDSITVDSATLVRKFVRNNSGVNIPKGAAVYQTSSSGTTLTVALADASAEATAAQTLGLAQEAIPDNGTGYIVAVGQLDGISTAALTEGQIVWLSETAGQLTTTRPTQPAHGVVVGYCVKQGAGTSGILYVKVTNGQELDELHDVLITSPTAGQVLRRAADGLWKNAALAAADVTGLSAVATTGAYSDLSGRPTLGTAAAANTGTAAGNVVTLDGSARLPAVDGSQLTGLPSAPVTSVAGRTGAVTLAVGDVANAVATSDARLSDARTPLAHNQAWGSITETPTTLSGYGITDALSTTATRAANLVFAGPASGAAAAPTFRALVAADLPVVTYSQHSTITASGSPSTYTLDAAGYNEFTASAAVAGNVTITASNLASVPSGQVWRAVFRFAYTSGAITLAAPAGTTVKGALGTLTAGQTYDLVVRFIGGGSVLDYRLGGGFTT